MGSYKKGKWNWIKVKPVWVLGVVTHVRQTWTRSSGADSSSRPSVRSASVRGPAFGPERGLEVAFCPENGLENVVEDVLYASLWGLSWNRSMDICSQFFQGAKKARKWKLGKNR